MSGRDPNEEHDDAISDTTDPELGLTEDRTSKPLEVAEADWEESDPVLAAVPDDDERD